MVYFSRDLGYYLGYSGFVGFEVWIMVVMVSLILPMTPS